jgi:hypothetical protein
MIPEKVKIGCYDYDIVMTNEIILVDNHGCIGEIDYRQRQIKISTREERSGQNHEQTLWHEIVHGIVEHRNLDPTKVNLETTVDELATGLYGLCKDNGFLPGQDHLKPK